MKKSLRRKLLLSGLAMGVAAISLASTTYAWFSNIDTVTANNLAAKVDVPTSLLINGGTETTTNVGDAPETNWVSSINFTDLATASDAAVTSQTAINPVKKTPVTNGLPTFQELTPEGKKLVDENGKFNGTNTEYGAYLVDSAQDVFNDIFWLKYDGQPDEVVNVETTIALDTANTVLGAAMKWEIYEYTDSKWVPVKNGDFSTPDQDVVFTIEGFETSKARCFAVYLYLDGEHANCKNASVTAVSNYDLDISFKKVTPVSNS